MFFLSIFINTFYTIIFYFTIHFPKKFFKIPPNTLFAELLDFKEDTLDTTLINEFKKFSKKDRDILKNVIVHLDKNY